MQDTIWSAERITRADQQYVWHPYAPRMVDTGKSADAFLPPIPVASTEGVNIHFADGRTAIDGMSSWWAACHGHGHPHLKAAAHGQIERMSHVMFGGLTHQPAAELAERLINFCNDVPAQESQGAQGSQDVQQHTPLDSVFFSDSGSVAVEVALKMALQYQRGAGHPERTRFLTWRGGYHGDTQGPMSVCDPQGGMHALWKGTLTRQHFVPAPPTRGADPEERTRYLHHIQDQITRAGTIAAVIVEPLVQGAGGMRFHDPELITGLRRICDATGALLILDEIATAFGRTGHTLACHAAGVLPDILCLGKALTGGFMSFAATLSSAAVAEKIDTTAGGGALMHGPTFMGNPLACAVAGASLDLIESGYWRESVPRIERQLRVLQPLAELPGVADVRVMGAIGVVELAEPVPMRRATQLLLDRSVWLRPFGRLLYTMPPFVASEQEVSLLCDAITHTAHTLAVGRESDA
ncbi:MAG TPA: adenosylmethionine--8-amino-7-oxononanoate transaminase [Candidatus Corynebacterium gallistercoris]|uniref:Adenosylmethionine-8-amino-7-oxononanoate aminotransferase n=1 Tax=Candidatus Corynebacterium gallistercoris TaxID=2838530 RepID=A0A9D1URU8_9CORY|nr:adenosylmethionine--8-amino-7-oxononanoate transaminase [Candidatus Corynebacterium gallistercoris]